jgi:hypothetical protein
MEQNVVLSLSENGNSVTGKLYHNPSDVVVFQGIYKDKIVTGSIDYANEKWSIVCRQDDHKIHLQLSSLRDNKTHITTLEKLSHNPSYSVKKAFDAFRYDKAVLGEWQLIRIEDSNGNPRQIPNYASGGTYTFYSNGTFKISSPYVEEVKRKYANKYAIKNATDPLGNWETKGSMMYQLGPESGIGRKESWFKYQVKGDTLIFFNANETSYFIKRK